MDKDLGLFCRLQDDYNLVFHADVTLSNIGKLIWVANGLQNRWCKVVLPNGAQWNDLLVFRGFSGI